MSILNVKALADKAEKLYEKQWFFVAGFEKSGTTWLQKMLNSHPEISCIGEGHALRNLGKPLQILCNEFNTVITTTNKAVYNNEALDYQNIDIETFRSIFMALVAASIIKMPDEKIKFFGDKTPNNIVNLIGICQLFPNPKIFHIVRDGRDVLVSYCKHMQRNYPDEALNEHSYEGSVERISKAWGERVRLGIAFKQQNASQLHEVRYEDLLVNPENELKKIHAFLGANSTDEQIKACVEASSFETLSGGRKTGEESTSSFYRKGVAGDWQHELSPEVLRIFNENAGDALDALGYKKT